MSKLCRGCRVVVAGKRCLHYGADFVMEAGHLRAVPGHLQDPRPQVSLLFSADGVLALLFEASISAATLDHALGTVHIDAEGGEITPAVLGAAHTAIVEKLMRAVKARTLVKDYEGRWHSTVAERIVNDGTETRQ